MSLFGKKRRSHTVPEVPDHPICAYVERVDPKVHNGVAMPQKIGTFDFLEDRHDLVVEVERVAGGGKFKARIFNAEDKKKYLGIDTFAISAQPLIDGRPVEPRAEPRLDWEARRLESIEEQIQKEAAEAKIDKAELLLAQIKAGRRNTNAERKKIEQSLRPAPRKPTSKRRRRRLGG